MWQKLGIYIGIPVATLVVGVIVGFYLFPNITGVSQGSDCGTTYTFINKNLGCQPSEDTALSEVTSIENNLNDLINSNESAGKATKIAVYFRDLTNNKWVGINENDDFAPGSLLKVPLMIAYYKEAALDPSILDQKITFTAPKTGNTDSLEALPAKQHLVSGTTYSVSGLIEFMVEQSSNEAATILYNRLDPKVIDEVFYDMQVHIPTSGGAEQNFLSASVYANMIRSLYNSSYLTREYSEKALNVLSQSSFVDGLVAGVPQGTVIAHKFGDRNIMDQNGNSIGKGLNDCGIVYKPNHPYLLCVMTQGNDFDNLKQTIQSISRLVYSQIQ